jgi:hypothetical protein
MIELSTRRFVSLLVLLAAAPWASSQTPHSGSLSSQVAARKSGKSGNSRGSLAAGAIPAASLCFQPGVGWQRTLTEQTTEPASAPASGGNRQSANPRLSSAQPAHSDECADKLPDERGFGVGVGKKFSTLNRTIGSTGSTTNPGTVTPRQLNSPAYLNGSSAPQPARTTLNAAPTPAALKAGQGAPSDQPEGRAFHAYTSSIKLRRLIRDAPDFRTRIKLQQLQDHSGNQLHHARVDTKPGAAAGGRLQAGRVSRMSSAGSVTRGGPRDHPRTPLPGAHR